MKKLLFVLLLISLNGQLSNAQTGWFVQPSFTSSNLYDCKFSASNNMYAGSDLGKIYRSTNGGLNWTIYNFNDPTLDNCSFKYVLGQNNDNFAAVGTLAGYAFSWGTIDSAYRITGATPSPTLEALSAISGYFFYSATLAAGAGGKFYIQDASNNYIWRNHTPATNLAAGRNINYSWGNIFVGDGGLIMFADSIGLPAPNGEAIKWRIIPSSTNKNINCIMGGGGWPNYIAVGDDGLILRSTNYGLNWTTIPSPTTEDLYGVWLGYAYLICGANGTILRSYTQSLDKWYKQNTPTTQDLYFINSLGYSEYISGGESGIFLRTTDGGGALKRFIGTHTIEGFYNPATNLMVGDTINVTLRASASPYNIIESGKGTLSTSGYGNIEIGPRALNSVPYWIQINHRNSIETWSKTTQVFANNDLYYDFYAAASRAYGDNQKFLEAGRYGFYSGDFNQDGSVNLTDVIGVYNAASAFTNGYVPSDMNGDNISDLTDVIITNNNSNSFVGVMKP